MKIQLEQLRKDVNILVRNFGFSDKDSMYCAEIIIDAELAGKPSHGIVRLVSMDKMIKDGRVQVSKQDSEIIKQTDNSLLVDGKKKPGFMVVPFTIECAINKLQTENKMIICAGATNTTPSAGMIGYYARKATQADLIYIGFHNSMSYLVPFGSKKPLWGTNPVTIGVPSNSDPVIWDSGSSKISVGDILLAKREGQKLGSNIAIDKNGDLTTDPSEALMGGIFPFSNHKGSGMAMMVELLAGALINSSIDKEHQWNWGSFFVLINPESFVTNQEFKKSVSKSVRLLKESEKSDGFSEIYYPGEKSNMKRKAAIEKGEIEVNENTYREVMSLLSN